MQALPAHPRVLVKLKIKIIKVKYRGISTKTDKEKMGTKTGPASS
jgi:hypothetical protein